LEKRLGEKAWRGGAGGRAVGSNLSGRMAESPRSRWPRVLLKLSGEAFAGADGNNIDGAVVAQIASEIVEARNDLGVEIAVVVGGGNIWRGATGANSGIDRATADYMGMLATVMNALALQDALEKQGQQSRTLSAIHMAEVAEPYIRRRALRHLEKGRVVIFAAGIGQPFLTTDTPAAMRAAEMDCKAVLKATHGSVDGIYTADPRIDPTATRYDHVSYAEVLEKGLKVMDATAIAFCMDNKLPIVVFNMLQKGNIRNVLIGDPPIGTLVS
jgi:uridylate kinase